MTSFFENLFAAFKSQIVVVTPSGQCNTVLDTMVPYADITQDLRDYIYITRSKINDWVEVEKASIDAAAERYRQTLSMHQKTIDQKTTQLGALKLEGGDSRNKSFNRLSEDDVCSENSRFTKEQLKESQTQVQQEIHMLKGELQNKQEHIQNLTSQVEQYKGKAQEAESLKKRVVLSQQTTIDDLTRGILNNKYLGLDFQKAEHDALRFVFTQIDPNESSREFYFTIKTNELDEYEVLTCEPAVDNALLEDLRQQLNESDDMSAFVREMRKVFVNMV